MPRPNATCPDSSAPAPHSANPYIDSRALDKKFRESWDDLGVDLRAHAPAHFDALHEIVEATVDFVEYAGGSAGRASLPTARADVLNEMPMLRLADRSEDDSIILRELLGVVKRIVNGQFAVDALIDSPLASRITAAQPQAKQPTTWREATPEDWAKLMAVINGAPESELPVVTAPHDKRQAFAPITKIVDAAVESAERLKDIRAQYVMSVFRGVVDGALADDNIAFDEEALAIIMFAHYNDGQRRWPAAAVLKLAQAFIEQCPEDQLDALVERAASYMTSNDRRESEEQNKRYEHVRPLRIERDRAAAAVKAAIAAAKAADDAYEAAWAKVKS